jgi:magnesium transporter
MQIFAYNEDELTEREINSVAEIEALRRKWSMVWVNVSGLGDPSLIAGLGEIFQLHPLALEDVLHTPQRSKIDEYDDNVLLIVRMVEKDNDMPILDQLSLFWGDGFVLSIQERPGDVFGPVRERLRKGGKRVKMSHSDYLAYALLDAVIDGYFPVLEQYGDKLDALEDKIVDAASPDCIHDLHKAKREINVLRLCLWPMRDAISRMRGGTDFVRDETIIYLRDCQDHIVQILDILESYRERISALNDLYLSSISNRLNEVMKVLTIISTIFMPLSFIAGIYGMNFDTSHPYNMPELRQPYGYVVVMTIMTVAAAIMLFSFWRAGWISFKKKS